MLHVKQAWNSLAFAKWIGSSNKSCYLCTKTMDKKAIEEVLTSLSPSADGVLIAY